MVSFSNKWSEDCTDSCWIEILVTVMVKLVIQLGLALSLSDCANWAKDLHFGLGLIFKLGEKGRFDILRALTADVGYVPNAIFGTYPTPNTI